jgi:DNA adenine methylase
MPRGAGDAAFARPFVKWAGGKGQVLGELKARVPSRYGRYYEPFVGGGALFFATSPTEATLSDKNPFLINAYAVVRGNPGELIVSLRNHRADRAYYYSMRDLDPAALSDVERASWFIYLNRTCYNGLWRVNSKGRFNVPFGRYANPRILDEDNLRKVSEALRRATILCADFTSALGGAKRGDFVYLDPPYHPLGGTSDFTGYVEGGFGPSDQDRLSKVFRDLTGAGVLVMLSNSDTELVRRLYSGFRVETIRAKRPINCRSDRRGAVSEVIVRNY